jgi:hypothetical protein
MGRDGGAIDAAGEEHGTSVTMRRSHGIRKQGSVISNDASIRHIA